MMNTELDLDAILDRVSDRASFLVFVNALAADRRDAVAQEQQKPSSPYGSDANGWENTTIEAFLEAAISWSDGSNQLPHEPSWQAFATFLYCGKIYE